VSIGRITNQMVSQQILANVDQAEDALDSTEEELSSGLSISQPSDNPYGASLAVALNGQLSQLSDYTSNITDGTAWTQTASSSLSGIQQDVQTAQELVVQAGNGTNSQADLNSIADEISQLTASVKAGANAQYNGQYIFAGSATATAPYQSVTGDTYQGNTGAVTRAILPGTPALQVNANLSSVLGNGAASGDGGLLDTLETITSDLQSGNTTALNSTDLANLTTNLNALAGVQATVGSTQDRLQQASTQIQTLQTNATSALSNDQDANLATTETTFSNEQAAFQAALQAGASIVQTSLMNFLSSTP
jgi:flagellar hook-associated protein 3 FlgL